MKKAVLALILFAIVAMGYPGHGDSQKNAIITKIFVHEGHVYVTLEGEQVNCTGAINTSSYVLDKTDPNFKTMYAALLSIKSTQSPVTFYLAGNGGRDNHYQKIISITF